MTTNVVFQCGDEPTRGESAGRVVIVRRLEVRCGDLELFQIAYSFVPVLKPCPDPKV